VWFANLVALLEVRSGIPVGTGDHVHGAVTIEVGVVGAFAKGTCPSVEASCRRDGCFPRRLTENHTNDHHEGHHRFLTSLTLLVVGSLDQENFFNRNSRSQKFW